MGAGSSPAGRLLSREWDPLGGHRAGHGAVGIAADPLRERRYESWHTGIRGRLHGIPTRVHP